MVAKRKIAFQPAAAEKGGCYPAAMAHHTPPKTVRRNARERNRVKQIDVGFEKLKMNIPVAAAQKKISRVKILASAVDYIQQLHTILNEHEAVCRTPAVKQEQQRAVTPPKPAPLHPANTPTAAINPALASTPYHQQQGGGYMTPYPMQNSPMNTHSPLSPYSDYSGSMSSGYYSQHSPSLRSTSYRDFYSPRVISPVAAFSPLHHCKESPGYAESPHHPYPTPPHTQVAPPAAPPAPPPLTQDPTTSSTFQEEDEEILNSIIQWEKF